jgi:peptide/nickel transport system substrate-binding protein
MTLASCWRRDGQPLLVVGFEGRPLSLDPHHKNDAVTWSVLSNFYDGLVRFSSELKLEPALAESWEQLDATHWKFHLRKNVRFQRGEPFRAGDVVASFERARADPQSGIRHHVLGVTRMTAADDLTLVVETDGPRPTLLNRLVFLPVVPAGDAKLREITEPNGTGPYRLVRHDDPNALILEGWPGWRGMPEIRRVKFIFATDNRALLTRFLDGEIDVLREVPEDRLADLRDSTHVRAEPQPRLAIQMIAVSAAGGIGEGARALTDARVRQAILLGCDRQRWVGEVYRGDAVVASQYVHPVVFGYDTATAPQPYDPQKARELLAQAGFPNGFDLTVDCTPAQEIIIPSLVADFARIGIRLTPRVFEWDQLVTRMREGKSALGMFAWSCSTGDASDFLTTCVHSPSESLGLGRDNYAHFRDPEVDALIEASERELDGGHRLRLLQEAQRRTLQKLPYLPLTDRWVFLGASDRVEVVIRHDQWLWIAAYRWRASR